MNELIKKYTANGDVYYVPADPGASQDITPEPATPRTASPVERKRPKPSTAPDQQE